MYYNKIFRVWVFDPFDYFFISAFLASILTRHLKNYLSEKASMKRLKNSIIKKSQLIEASNSKVTKFSSKGLKFRLKVQEICKFVFMPRGGVIRLAVFLKDKELRAEMFKILFTAVRISLQIVLSLCDINLQYVVVNEVNPQTVVIIICAGGTTGFVSSWFSVGAFLLTPPTILSFFLLRSLTQQFLHNAEYIKWERFQKEMKTFFIDIQKNIDNSNKIKLENLNWNKNPAIKEAAERLGIFENAPNAIGKLNLDTLDPNPDLKKFLEESGIIGTETTNLKTRIKRKIGKTVNFKDFVDNNKSDLDVIDAEIVNKTVQIRIKD